MPAARTKKDDLSPNSPDSDEGKDGIKDLNGSSADPSKPKRKRQSQSCDACRARKVKCARENPDDAGLSCKHCIALGIKCTYDYQPKKRGPPNLYLKRLQEAAAAAAAAQRNGSDMNTLSSPSSSSHDGLPHISPISTNLPLNLNHMGPSSASSSSGPQLPMSHHSHHPSMSHPHHQSHSQPPQNPHQPPYPDTTLSPLPPSRYPIAADTFHHHPQSFGQPPSLASLSPPFGTDPVGNSRPGTASTTNGDNTANTPGSMISPSTIADTFSPYPLYGFNMPSGPSGGSATSSTLPPGSSTPSMASPGPQLPAYPHLRYWADRRHSLSSLPVSRTQIMHIISLFFDFVYPLTPCVHKPSFMSDLHAHREEHDSLFFALVLSTIASTLVQVPRSYLPMERAVVRKLAQTCSEMSRLITIQGYDPPSVMHVVIRYFDTIYHFCEGHDATSHASFGEAAHIAVTLHMHEEASYEGLEPIECEIRRRAFWLLFGADKSMSILLGRPICLRDEDCTLHFPKEVDDEYITPNGILPQPHGKTAIVSGLNYISRIFALLGEILVRIRVDKRSPPQGPFATARLEEIRSLHTRIVSALMHAPAPLRLKSGGMNNSGPAGAAMTSPSGGSSRYEYNGLGNAKTTLEEVRNFFDNPNASRTNASNPFLVMQANLYVTQQLVRFVIEQYRDELITSMRSQMGDVAMEGDSRPFSEDRDAVASDLLNVLHSIPIQSIATNGPSLVHKVRFVASTLLDAVRKAETAPASAARAHAYLWDFLSILSEIERNYVLDDDRDGDSSQDSLPV